MRVLSLCHLRLISAILLLPAAEDPGPLTKLTEKRSGRADFVLLTLTISHFLLTGRFCTSLTARKNRLGSSVTSELASLSPSHSSSVRLTAHETSKIMLASNTQLLSRAARLVVPRSVAARKLSTFTPSYPPLPSFLGTRRSKARPFFHSSFHPIAASSSAGIFAYRAAQRERCIDRSSTSLRLLRFCDFSVQRRYSQAGCRTGSPRQVLDGRRAGRFQAARRRPRHQSRLSSVSSNARVIQNVKDLLDDGTAAVIRIVPVRNTDFNHLRDGFIRALQNRLKKAIKDARVADRLPRSSLNSSSLSSRSRTRSRAARSPRARPLDLVILPTAVNSKPVPASLNFEYDGQVFGQVTPNKDEVSAIVRPTRSTPPSRLPENSRSPTLPMWERSALLSRTPSSRDSSHSPSPRSQHKRVVIECFDTHFRMICVFAVSQNSEIRSAELCCVPALYPQPGRRPESGSQAGKPEDGSVSSARILHKQPYFFRCKPRTCQAEPRRDRRYFHFCTREACDGILVKQDDRRRQVAPIKAHSLPRESRGMRKERTPDRRKSEAAT
ncbi:hypothetical protein L1887_58839 [Cichorium endivia]|nr:hypothetical protein L1887_58839 [Cichorium endivia]